MKKKSGKPSAAAEEAGSPESTQSGAFCLPASVAIRNARELREQCLARVADPSIRVDGSAVSDVDTAGLQLILAWQRAIGSAGGQFEWTSVSAALREAAVALGLSRELGMPGAA